MLRKILSKFSVVDHTRSASAFGVLYTGRDCKELTAEEERYRGYIEDLTMRDADAARVMEHLDIQDPFYTRVEWIRAIAVIAALANTFRDDMKRLCPGPNRQIWHSAFCYRCGAFRMVSQ